MNAVVVSLGRLSSRSGPRFCTQTRRVRPNPEDKPQPTAGRSSYIGFGKFDGMGPESGSLSKAMAYFKEALEIQKAIERTPENIRVEARFHHEIAMCHHRMRSMEQAIQEYRNAIGILENLLVITPSSQNSSTVLKRTRFDLSTALSGLSVALADENLDAESLDCALRALEIRKSMLGANHPSVAECLNNLGGLYFRQSSFNKAAEAYQESLRVLLTKTGGKEENKYVALAYFNIGLTYKKLGLNKGVDAIQKALLISNHIWGPEHEQTIQISTTLQEIQSDKKS
jgi:tetratricopeptide (TPR) repeat protein